jgi:hypothetical protein
MMEKRPWMGFLAPQDRQVLKAQQGSMELLAIPIS